jgi:hypothetical protein
MLLIIAAFQLPLLTKQLTTNSKWFYISLAVSVWLVYFLVFLRSFSGIATFAAVMGYCLILILYRSKNKIVKLTFAIISIGVLAFGVWLFSYMYKITHTKIETDLSSLPANTKNGNPYFHDPSQVLRENGHLVYIYIADAELDTLWNSKSQIDFYGTERNNQPLRFTLYRYMSSKGLIKDKEGFQALTEIDIQAVEDGYTNHLYLEWPGIYSRIHVLMMGFYMYNNSPEHDPTWSTLTERFDLWKAALTSIQLRPILGWGTGRIETAVEYGLIKNNSLVEDKYIRSHNQYLSLLLLWGVLGASIFISLYSYFVIKSGVSKIFMFNVFLITVATNGLVNDPIEGQIGQNLFIFFSIFYYHFYPKLQKQKVFVF